MTVTAPGFILHRAAAQVPIDQRVIVAPAPVAGATVLALDDASRLRPRETLLVGPAGPTLASVQIRALGPAGDEVTIAPPLASSFAIGDPVVPVVESDFATADAAEIALHREPTAVFGRIVKNSSGGTVPLAGATVRLIGVWRSRRRRTRRYHPIRLTWFRCARRSMSNAPRSPVSSGAGTSRRFRTR